MENFKLNSATVVWWGRACILSVAVTISCPLSGHPCPRPHTTEIRHHTISAIMSKYIYFYSEIICESINIMLPPQWKWINNSFMSLNILPVEMSLIILFLCKLCMIFSFLSQMCMLLCVQVLPSGLFAIHTRICALMFINWLLSCGTCLSDIFSFIVNINLLHSLFPLTL